MKPIFCKACGNPLENDGKCKMCPAGNPRRAVRVDTVDRTCPWNDHGYVCGKTGSLADSTNGTGPWYCSEHFWKMKGWEVKPVDPAKPHVSFRERWYKERGEKYQNPKLGDMPPFRCIGTEATILYDKLVRGELGKRMREPGEDTAEDIGHEPSAA